MQTGTSRPMQAMAKGPIATTAPSVGLAGSALVRCCWAPGLAWRGWGTCPGSAAWWAACCSPISDTRSQTPPVRWGPLGLLLVALPQGVLDRSVRSQQSAAGTAGRLAYLGVAARWACKALLSFFGGRRRQELLGLGPGACGRRARRPLVASSAAGVGAGGQQLACSLWQDGDPMPRLPRLLRRRWHSKRGPLAHARRCPTLSALAS